MKSLWKHAAAACAISVLAACGGGGGGTAASVPVAADVGQITLTSSTGSVVAQGLTGQNIVFPTGLTVDGVNLAAPVTLTFRNNGTEFTLTDANGQTATGTVSFSSIVFNIGASTIPGLTTGLKPSIPILIDLNTSGVAANGSSVSVPVIITIGGKNSSSTTITISISSNAAIQIGGTTVGNVTFTTTTGATGGS